MAAEIVRKPIPGHDPYLAGDDGGIWRLKPSGWKLLRAYLHKGYPTVKLRGRSFFVHVLVCKAFHGLPLDGQEVCHRDDVKTNSSPTNLRWGTRKSNFDDLARSGKSGLKVGGAHMRGVGYIGKLTIEQREAIITAKGSGSQMAVAKRFGVSQRTVGKLWAGEYAPLATHS